MRRRTVVGFLAAAPIALLYRTALAGEVRAHMRLERKPNWQVTCVRCIPGVLYGTDSGLPQRLCDTVELSFEDNAVNVSAIPAGTYRATVRRDRTKKWMIDDITEWRLELQGVPGDRRAIQFHYGKEASWSQGCIIVGSNNALACGRDDCAFSDSPRDGVRALRDYVMARLLASDDYVEVSIS
jgi:hypothetical protein